MHGPTRASSRRRTGDASDLHRNRELDRANARDGAVRGRGAGGICGRDSDHPVRPTARLGTLQRGRDHGRTGASGAGDPERAERAVWISCKMNLAFLGVLSVFFIAFAPGIVGLFGGTAGASAIAVTGLVASCRSASSSTLTLAWCSRRRSTGRGRSGRPRSSTHGRSVASFSLAFQELCGRGRESADGSIIGRWRGGPFPRGRPARRPKPVRTPERGSTIMWLRQRVQRRVLDVRRDIR